MKQLYLHLCGLMSFCPITGHFCSWLVSQLLRLLQKSNSQTGRPLPVSWHTWLTVVIKDTREERATHMFLNTPLSSGCCCSEDTHPPRQASKWLEDKNCVFRVFQTTGPHIRACGLEMDLPMIILTTLRFLKNLNQQMCTLPVYQKASINNE